MILLAFVVPVAIYCLVLAAVNRCRHPVVVPGPWDFAGVLFAASGFLLLGGPAILTGLYEQWRLSWLLGQTRFLNGAGENWGFWVGLWALYFALVAAGSALLLWRRRRQTSIYNIEPAVLEAVLAGVLDRLGLEAVRTGSGRFSLRVPRGLGNGDGRRGAAPVSIPAAAAGRSEGRGARGEGREGEDSPLLLSSTCPGAELAIDPFPAMYHVTLHWADATGLLRREVEAELTRVLAEVVTRDNPVGGFFMSLSSILFLLTLLGILVLLVFRILSLPR